MIDVTNFYGNSMSQVLLDDQIEMWHSHPDLYKKKPEEILKTPDDSVFGYFLEVDLKYPENVKEKTKKIPFVLKIKVLLKKI